MKRIVVLLTAIACINLLADAQTENYSFTQDNFRQSEQFNKPIDIQNPDVEIMDAAIFYVTNETRIKHGLSELK